MPTEQDTPTPGPLRTPQMSATRGLDGATHHPDRYPEPSRDAYEALADLFLSDMGFEPAASGSGSSEPSRARHRAESERPGTTAASRPSFVVGSEARDRTNPVIEAVLLGHLPGLAGAWVLPYAAQVAARTGGPVAVVRLNAGGIRLDIVNETAGALGNLTSELLPASGGNAPLEPVVRTLAGDVRVWLLCLDASAPAAPLLNLCDRIVILTGTNKAAVVAAYGAIKRLRGDNGVARPAQIDVVLAGPQAPASDAGTRLEQVAQAFLRRGVRVAGCIPRLTAVPVQPVWSGAVATSTDSMIQRLVTIVRGVANAARCPDEAGAQAADAECRPPRPQAAGVGPRGAASAPRSQPPARTPVRLADHVPGLTPTSIRCPYAPGVEFAIDADGRWHLLAWASPHERVQLRAASAWLHDHAALLADVVPAATDALSPVVHLFTRHAPSAHHLRRTGWHVHLLVETPTGEMLCVDLR